MSYPELLGANLKQCICNGNKATASSALSIERLASDQWFNRPSYPGSTFQYIHEQINRCAIGLTSNPKLLLSAVSSIMAVHIIENRI